MKTQNTTDIDVINYWFHLLSVPNYPPPRRCASSVEQVVEIGEKLSKPTKASHAARYDFDNQLANVRYLEAKDPKYPGNSK